MTTQETIKIIKNEHCGRCDGKFICSGCYIGKAIEALEKQIKIEKVLERLEEESNFFKGEVVGTLLKAYYCKGVEKAIEIIKEEVG